MDIKRPALFVIMNHELTQAQQDDAVATLGVKTFIFLSPELSQLWCAIPPELEVLKEYLQPIKKWLCHNGNSGDYALIQGDPGGCFILANYCLARSIVPVYSTTKREAVEQKMSDSMVKMVRVFKHIKFRKYGI